MTIPHPNEPMPKGIEWPAYDDPFAGYRVSADTLAARIAAVRDKAKKEDEEASHALFLCAETAEHAVKALIAQSKRLGVDTGHMEAALTLLERSWCEIHRRAYPEKPAEIVQPGGS